MPKPKTEEAGSLSKHESQTQEKLYTQSDAAYGFVRNLRKTSNLSESQKGQFCLQRAPIEKLPWPHVTSKESMSWLYSKLNFSVSI